MPIHLDLVKEISGSNGPWPTFRTTMTVTKTRRIPGLSKALSVPPIGGNADGFLLIRAYQVVAGETLGQLAALGVPHPDPVADPEPVRGRAEHRGLHLAGALGLGQPQPGRPERRRQPVR